MYKKKKWFFILLLIIPAFMFVGGCAKIESRVSPGTDLSQEGKFYVIRHTEGEIHIDEMIRDELKSFGINARSGPPGSKPADTDVIVTYEDRWAWDMTTYLLSLTIQFHKAESNMLLATGQSYRPSLDRKPPEVMVKEIIESIFKQK